MTPLAYVTAIGILIVLVLLIILLMRSSSQGNDGLIGQIKHLHDSASKDMLQSFDAKIAALRIELNNKLDSNESKTSTALHAGLTMLNEQLVNQLNLLNDNQSKSLAVLRTTIAGLSESSLAGQLKLREDVTASITSLSKAVQSSNQATRESLQKQLEAFSISNEASVNALRDGLQKQLGSQLDRMSSASSKSLTQMQDQLKGQADSSNSVIKGLQDGLQKSLQGQLDGFQNQLKGLTDSLTTKVSSFQATVQDQLTKQLTAMSSNQANQMMRFQGQLKDSTSSSTATLKTLAEQLQRQVKSLVDTSTTNFNTLNESLSRQMGDIRTRVGHQLEVLQKDNAAQLEKMRATVDEKLQSTLENRLGKSFELVSKQLAAVQQGLGEMQNLASGVGDLKKVLTNVKTRGVMGEIQLGNILEQILTKEQYGINVSTIPGSGCHVEFAVKLPGRDPDQTQIWLPIDSKFPMDRYEQLQSAQERGDKPEIDQARKQLASTIKIMAKDIKEKYIAPPHTTDFGILFLPTEGLYAEVVRDTVLTQKVQQDFRIMIAGPTNLAALLNSLQMGFRSLAIEKRSSEVWQILGAVKTEFGKFGDVLAKVQKNLSQASNTIDKVGTRTRAIERKLRGVEALPEADVQKALPFDDGIDMEDFVGDNTPTDTDLFTGHDD